MSSITVNIENYDNINNALSNELKNNQMPYITIVNAVDNTNVLDSNGNEIFEKNIKNISFMPTHTDENTNELKTGYLLFTLSDGAVLTVNENTVNYTCTIIGKPFPRKKF